MDNRKHSLQTGIIIALAACTAYAVYRVIALHWICDDAFISFRYARNLVYGLGLVFNAGERVEGYTNFLWTCIIALGMALKADPVPLSMVLGGISYVLTVVLVGWISYRMSGVNGRRQTFFLPIASIALLLNRSCHEFATGGLETAFFMMLTTAGFCVLVLARRKIHYATAGVLLALAALTRPEALLLVAVSALYVALSVPRAKMLRSAAALVIPFVVIFLPYWILRYRYYGFPFPNTWYAKSAGLPYYHQGWLYFKLYFESYYVLALLPVVALWAIVKLRRGLTVFSFERHEARVLLLAGLYSLAYMFYIVRVGGDFMFGRFFIPIVPLLFMLFETSIKLLCKSPRSLLPATIVLAGLVVLPWNVFQKQKMIDGIAHEAAFYSPAWLQNARETGRQLQPYLAETGAKVAFSGTAAALVYYSEFPVAIEAQTGLTDTFIAHQVLATRGRPGHEKRAPRDYLLRRGVNFCYPVPDIEGDTSEYLILGGFRARILVRDTLLMEHLKQCPGLGCCYLGLERLFWHARKTGNESATGGALLEIYNRYRQNPGAIKDHPRPEILEQELTALAENLRATGRDAAADSVTALMRAIPVSTELGRAVGVE